MNKAMHFQYSPVKFVLTLLSLYLGFCFLQRLFYLAWISIYSGILVEQFLVSFLKGVSFDLISGVLIFSFPTFLLLIAPKKWLHLKTLRGLLGILFSLCLYLIFFMALAEGFFFAEFHSRYNFIAVDYLVYSHEVLHNAIESYPLFWILTGLTLFWIPFAYFVARGSFRLAYPTKAVRSRLALTSILLLTPAPLFLLTEGSVISNDPHWAREVSKNTLFTLFSAYNHNSINFQNFYATLDSKTARHTVHEWLEEEDGEELDPLEPDTEDEFSIIRNISSRNPQKKWNVVFVVIESMSARYTGLYGNKNNWTPNLDKLANEGLFFEKFYATGTRTVRGLEALLLSLPPTPGQSILRRPHSDGLFNLGSVFNQNGYHSQFIYGGYSYFDNMRSWFGSNGFEVIDRASFPSDEIHFSNVWGVCDEDLFDQALKQGDRLYNLNKPFFQTVLTTSNHRPYTYPDHRIDIPSHTGRSGAVKYTDYAIGRFIRMAKDKPWFANTLFIFVADHNGSVAGGANIPIQDYLIPLIFYNPHLIPTQKIDKISSQIDFAPTLLGLMKFTYQSRFFGQNLLKAKAGRAILGTYQKVALMRQGHMTILAPNRKVESQALSESGQVLHSDQVVVDATNVNSLPEEIKKTIAIYQAAGELFNSGQDKVSRRFSTKINLRNF